MFKKPSQSFIDAIAQSVQEKPAIVEEVHVHGYGVISRARAEEGLLHHLEQVKNHTLNRNHSMAANHAEYAMHYANGIRDHDAKVNPK